MPGSRTHAGESRSKGIQSVELGFRVLQALVEASGPQSLKAVAERAGMSPSKARMYLVSLVRVGLAAQGEEGGSYRLGPYAVRIGSMASQRNDLLASAEQVMTRMAERTGALMLLSGWGHGGAMLLRQTEGRHALQIDFRIGSQVSLTRTATGHVCLAFLPQHVTAPFEAPELAENAHDADLAFINVAYLKEVVAAVQAMGTATVKNVRIGSGLVLVGYTAVAAPVFDRDGDLRLVMTALLAKRDARLDLAAARALLRRETLLLSGWDEERMRNRKLVSPISG